MALDSAISLLQMATVDAMNLSQRAVQVENIKNVYPYNHDLVMSNFAKLIKQREAQIEHYIQSYVQSKPIEDFAFTLNGNNYKYDCLLTTRDNLPALRVSYDRI